MIPAHRATPFALAVAALLCASAIASAQPAPAGSAASAATATAPASQLPADPWPRVVDLANGQVLVYQPQVSKWEGNRIDFRAALAIKVTGAKEETFGVIFATARTQVDKIARMVVFEDMRIGKIDFPTLPDRGAAYAPELQKEFASKVRTIALDRLQSSLASAGGQAAHGAGAEQSAAGAGQLFAGDPGADRRRAGDEAAPDNTALPARAQHARADPQGRLRATNSSFTSTTAG